MHRIITVEGIQKTVFGAGASIKSVPSARAISATRALLVMDRQLASTEIAAGPWHP